MISSNHNRLRITGKNFPCAAALVASLFAFSPLSLCSAEKPPAALVKPYIVDHSQSPHALLRPLPFDAVQWTDGFWADRFRQLSQVTLNESWRLLADPKVGGVLENFRIAGGSAKGSYYGSNWQDEWLYKWIEAAACVWRATRDSQVEQRMDEAIRLIATAQQPDGYLSCNVIVRGTKRFQEPREHEIYNMGHLISAGVIHYRMTGKPSLLQLAQRAADFLCATVGTTVKPYFAHNPSALMGLIELYRLTGQRKYLACAQLIVDKRGSEPRANQSLWAMQPGIGGTDQIQDRVPLREATEVVGHNVFFTYLFTGASDLQAEIGDRKLEAALQRLWEDLTGHKMFLIGGVSAVPVGLSHNAPVVEATGAAYDLPNAGCYNETCGQIGCFMWAYRMLCNHPEARYADLMEREMFNGFLGAVGLDGRSWFYRSILRRYDENYEAPAGWTDMAQRGQPSPATICCPSNLLRTMAQLSAYFYSQDDSGLWVHHFGGSRVTCQLPGKGEFALEQITDYPWSGEVKLAIRKTPVQPIALRVHVPGWAATPVAFSLNGVALKDVRIQDGYSCHERIWKAGDTLVMTLPMTGQLIAGNPNIEQVRNQVAVMRGPIVYCVESPDLPPGVRVPDVHLTSDVQLKPIQGLLSATAALGTNVVSLQGRGLRLQEPPWTGLYRPLGQEKLQPFDLRLIPYFAWANRGHSAMSVWMPVVLKDNANQ
jgi:DUF1680 family protein